METKVRTGGLVRTSSLVTPRNPKELPLFRAGQTKDVNKVVVGSQGDNGVGSGQAFEGQGVDLLVFFCSN